MLMAKGGRSRPAKRWATQVAKSSAAAAMARAAHGAPGWSGMAGAPKRLAIYATTNFVHIAAAGCG